MTKQMNEMAPCTTCGKMTLHLYHMQVCNHVVHLLVTIFLLGLWLPVWILAALTTGTDETLTCMTCGSQQSHSQARKRTPPPVPTFNRARSLVDSSSE
jgi:hypothetical protein